MPVKFWDDTDDNNGQLYLVSLFLFQTLRDAAGFAACRLLRQLMGMFTFHEILRITDIDKRTKIEKAAINISVRLLTEHTNINNIEDVITIIRDESKDLVCC